MYSLTSWNVYGIAHNIYTNSNLTLDSSNISIRDVTARWGVSSISDFISICPYTNCIPYATILLFKSKVELTNIHAN